MRNRFKQQMTFGQLPIEETVIPVKSKNTLDELLAALKEIYCNKEYNEYIFSILENHISSTKKKTGRTGMDLWSIFVLAQVRLGLNVSYDMLHNLTNNHKTMRQIMGIERDYGFERIEYEYQNIYDNVTLLTDEIVSGINDVIIEFGHKEVFKKKENTPLRLKTDSFVVESNVHFPTDYNLLWDSIRKCTDAVNKFLEKYETLRGWRKMKNWRQDIKGLMREVGKASSSGGKGKQERVFRSAERYLKKVKAFMKKLQGEIQHFPQNDKEDLLLLLALEDYMTLAYKHIDLVNRRILKEEKIPHEEKLFSIFETYTEWIKKGKRRPAVELGKKLAITTDQYDLIVDYRLMDHKQDRDIVIELADKMLCMYLIAAWSFDKGFWKKENKEMLQLEIPHVVMPKLGKRNKAEEAEETSYTFKRLKNRHSAIESNINELENRGLDRCPDRNPAHFSRYIGLGVSAYNLKKIGRKILEIQRQKLEKEQKRLLKAA